MVLRRGPAPVLVTGNETNNKRVFGTPNEEPYLKDGIDRYVVHGETEAVDRSGVGTKAAFHHKVVVPAGGSAALRFRLSYKDFAEAGATKIGAAETGAAKTGAGNPFADFGDVMSARRSEADEFWANLLRPIQNEDAKLMTRQALSGMLWSKQYYGLDVGRWLTEHGVEPFSVEGGFRNQEWRHLLAEDVISMPDKWEYPWFAAWDLAFHAVALAVVDVGLAKQQLELLLDRRYLHPNGQLSAYEWNFSDVNPPVHAWATYFVYEIEKARTGKGDRAFLEHSFQKMMRNFVWWLNRKDLDGRNVFQGGFLGLDNIGVFDRSAPLPTGGHIDQADGTAWMALCTQNMMQIALELAREDPVYVEQALALFENFCWIAAATMHVGPDGVSMWNEEDGFYYDLLRLPDGSSVPLKVRSIVGLMPLAAATVIPASVRTEFPDLVERAAQFLYRHPDVMQAMWGRGRQIEATGPALFALFDEIRLRRILARMLDEEEFLGPHGVRSVSRWHKDHPYTFTVHGEEYSVGYLPAESDTGMFGGNSNWRGPVWMPINLILLRALVNIYAYEGDGFTVECPTGSGQQMNLFEVAQEIGLRLARIFLRGRMASARSTAGSHCCKTTLIGVTFYCSTSISTATTGQASAPVTKQDGPGRWHYCPFSGAGSMRRTWSRVGSVG